MFERDLTKGARGWEKKNYKSKSDAGQKEDEETEETHVQVVRWEGGEVMTTGVWSAAQVPAIQ